MRAIAIEQNNASGTVSYWQGCDHQSQADRDGISLAPYIHALYGFLRQAGAREVLMIGGGGGTLATMLVKAPRPARGQPAKPVTVTMVDISAASFTIARRYFQLPGAVICHVADGVKFLRDHRQRYDAIVLDAFTQDKIPGPFWKEGFFALAKKRLRPGGIFLANVIVTDDDDPTPDDLCALMQGAWRTVRLLDTDGYVNRNAVALAGAVGELRRPRLMRRPRQRARRIAAELKGLGFRALRQSAIG